MPTTRPQSATASAGSRRADREDEGGRSTLSSNPGRQPEAEVAQPSWLNDEVRIGGKAITGQTNWAAMTHEQLYEAVVGGNDPSVVYGVSDRWISLGNNMLDSAMNLHQQVAATNSGWQGEAAESARNAVGQLVGWSGKAAQTAQFMGHQLNQQGQVMETAKNNMPGPVEFDAKMAAAVDPSLTGFAAAMQDTQAGQQIAAEAHARAIDVATQMEQASTQIDAATPEFEPVPTVISPNQIGTLTPRIHGTPAQTGVPLSATQSVAPQGYQPFEQSPATNGTPVQQYGTPQQPPTTGAPAAQQSYPGGTGGTQTQGYQPPPVSQPGYQQPDTQYHYQPSTTGSAPPAVPQNIYTRSTGNTSTSGYTGDDFGPGPAMPNPGSQSGPNWPTGGNPSSTGPFGSGPIGAGPFGAGPYGTSPYGSGPFGSGPGSENVPGGSGPGGTGPGSDAVRNYQAGSISSRLGSGGGGIGGSGATGARANAGASTGAGAAEAEGEGAGSYGAAAGRPGATPGMPGGAGSGGKRKEEDKEHKSAGYVEGEDIFEPLGGDLPPAVIGERRTRPAK